MVNLESFSSEWKRKSGIYCIANIANNKVYVGSSTELKMRWFSHRRELNIGTHRNDYLQKSWKKYGNDNFIIEVLEICNANDLPNREGFWISALDAFNKDKGYNIGEVGENHHLSEETKRKIGDANRGHVHTEATKRKIREKKLNIKHTDESRRNMSIAQKKKFSSGWKPSEESIIRSAEKRRGRKLPIETRLLLSQITKENNKSKRAVIMMDLNGNFLQKFNSIADGARFVKAKISKGSNSHIVDACSGRKKVAYGYKWAYSL